MLNAIDLSQLPKPTVIEELDYQALLDSMLDDFTSEYQKIEPSYSRPLVSDPVYWDFAQVAYRLIAERQARNDACYEVMPAYASGSNLDHMASFYKVTRLVLDEGDSSAVPPVNPIFESDEALRSRMILAPEGYTTAGSVGAYVFHALSSDGDVKNVAIKSPNPCDITITVLSNTGDGEASQSLQDKVEDYLSGEYLRPLGDRLTVQSAEIIDFNIRATLKFYNGPAQEIIIQAAKDALDTYLDKQNSIGRDITESGIHRALHQEGVAEVIISLPAMLPIECTASQAPYCASVNLVNGGIDE